MSDYNSYSNRLRRHIHILISCETKCFIISHIILILKRTTPSKFRKLPKQQTKVKNSIRIGFRFLNNKQKPSLIILSPRSLTILILSNNTQIWGKLKTDHQNCLHKIPYWKKKKKLKEKKNTENKRTSM